MKKVKGMNNLKRIARSGYSTIVSWDLKKITKVMLVVSLLAGAVGSYFWYNRMYMTPERRFWSAISNSMATSSVTRTVPSGGSGNKVTQDQQFFFAPQMATRSHVGFTQKSATVDTAIETEGIAFVDEQFSRYTAFRTNQTKEDGTTPNLDKVLGKWEGSKVEPELIDQSKSSYISDMVTLAIFGNFDSSFRKQTLDQLKDSDVYRFEVAAITDVEKDGEQVLVVPVSVGLKAYAGLVHEAFLNAGYGDFSPLNPDNYRADARISAQFVVRKKDNALVGISFGGREEQYSGYGITLEVKRPQAELSSGDLEKIVQEEIGSAF